MQYSVKAADNRADFEQFWKIFKLENHVPDVDSEKNGTIFIGLYESSCPSDIENIIGEKDSLIITIEADESPCDTIAIPKTVVIETAKETIQAPQAITIAENSAHTSVPISY